MCGRTCCTLSPDVVPLALTTVTPKGIAPTWTTKTSSYRPSTNVPPTRVTPILVREHKLKDGGECKEADYRLQPMLWGFIPPWHKGEEPTKHGYTTNNARIEGILESKMYRGAVNRGARCVVICDGEIQQPAKLGFDLWYMLGLCQCIALYSYLVHSKFL